MKPDNVDETDAIERAHLRDAADTSHAMHAYGAPAGLEDVVRRFWFPVWSVPPGAEAEQQVLQYPVCLLVVTAEYARFYGVVAGLSRTTLRGDGWAAGVMLTPAAGLLLTGSPTSEHTDRHVEIADAAPGGAVTVARVREAMAAQPLDPAAHAAAIAAYADLLRPLLPVDAEGALVNRVVAFVEERHDVLRVAQVCEEFGLSERALQRLVRRRVGLSPKWLIQRRRLHEAAARLRTPGTRQTDVAAALGYADQAHFIRDFSRVTGMTPGAFAARQAPR